MKKALLSLAAIAAFSCASAQQTYNYFDPADCDADGWLWFDSQEKLDKYCGFGDKYKIQLLSASYEDADGNFAEPVLDGTLLGYNAAGEQGEGAKTGAIEIPRASTYGAQNGGGIMMWLPDLAELSVFMSSEAKLRQPILLGGKGWIERVDMIPFKGFLFPFTSMTSNYQYSWNNLQDEVNDNAGYSLKSPAGEKVTACIADDMTAAILIQGIKVFTYTNTNAGSAVETVGDDANAPVEYLNMQGIKVSGEEPGLYIRRQGSSVTKVMK